MNRLVRTFLALLPDAALARSRFERPQTPENETEAQRRIRASREQ